MVANLADSKPVTIKPICSFSSYEEPRTLPNELEDDRNKRKEIFIRDEHFGWIYVTCTTHVLLYPL
jgi:hypothetical protein